MKTSLLRIRQGGVVLIVVFIGAVLGFRLLGDYGWTDAIWMVVVTISTVGFSEQSTLSPTLQMFTVVVILLGMSASAYTFGGLIQWMLQGELDRALGNRRMTRELNKLKRHTIICGYGRMGRKVASELDLGSHDVVVVEIDPEVCEDATTDGIPCIVGNATTEEVLRSAGVERASTLVAALPSDAESVFITLTARNLNPDLRIIARAEQQSTEKKLCQAGADRVVMPTVVGARQMVRMITRPITADLMELVSESGFVDLELDEIEVHGDSSLVGVTVRETEAHRKHNLLVIAIKGSDGELAFNPDADRQFKAHDVALMMGKTEDIKKFRDKYVLQ